MLTLNHPLGGKGLLRATLVAGFVLLSATVAGAQTFTNCAFSFWGSAYQAVMSNGSITAPTCDLQYKSSPPSNFTVDPGQLPPAGSNELLPNGLFSFMNIYANADSFSGLPTSTLWVQKGFGQNGITIVDDNANDNSPGANSSLDIRLFNVPRANYERYGVHVTLDPTSAQNQRGSLYGIAVGAHAVNSVGMGILTDGNGGIGIQSIEGDSQGGANNLFIIGHQFNHFSNGHVMVVNHQGSNMTGDVLQADMANTSGTFTGNFLNFLNNGTQEFKVDANGDVYVPSIKANSGTRFVCVDTTGKLISQTTPCSGT